MENFTGMQSKKIIIVDDHQLISAGIRSLVQHLSSRVELVECGSAREVLQLFAQPGQAEKISPKIVQYDLLLIDINMPSFNGLDLLNALKSRKVKIPAAMLSGTADIRTIQSCIDAGAVGFIPKTAHPELILEGLGKLLDGQRFIPPHLENYVFFDGLNDINKECRTTQSHTINGNHANIYDDANSGASEAIKLKKREKEVLLLIQEGKSNKQIAIILDISVSTVKFHITNLFRKFNARSRTECISLAAKTQVLYD